MNKATTTNILIILGILTVCVSAYYLFVSSGIEITDTRNESEFIAMQNRTNVFIERRQILSQVNFDFSLFNSDSFQNLEDFTDPVQQQPVGRANPFELPEPPQTTNNSDNTQDVDVIQ